MGLKTFAAAFGRRVVNRIARLQWQRRSDRFESLIERYSVETPDFFVLQVGACEGVLGDPIHKWIKKYRWRGILVEPQKSEFEHLTVTYRDCRDLRLENVAIADTDGTRALYRVRDDRRNAEWQRGVASFVRKARFVTEDMFEVEMVPCVTFDALLNRYRVARIDLLQIDAEGYDYELLKLFDFRRLRPRLIRYEHVHLPPSDRRACAIYLQRLGYETLEMRFDTGAVLRRTDTGR